MSVCYHFHPLRRENVILVLVRGDHQSMDDNNYSKSNGTFRCDVFEWHVYFTIAVAVAGQAGLLR